MRPRLVFRQSLADFVDEAQPAMHLSCDWLTDPLALGIMLFPVWTYNKLRELRNGTSSS